MSINTKNVAERCVYEADFKVTWDNLVLLKVGHIVLGIKYYDSSGLVFKILTQRLVLLFYNMLLD